MPFRGECKHARRKISAGQGSKTLSILANNAWQLPHSTLVLHTSVLCLQRPTLTHTKQHLSMYKPPLARKPHQLRLWYCHALLTPCHSSDRLCLCGNGARYCALERSRPCRSGPSGRPSIVGEKDTGGSMEAAKREVRDDKACST